MNDSLALDMQPATRLVEQPTPPAREAPVASYRRTGTPPPRIGGSVARTLPPASIESRLRLGAPGLFEASGADTRARFVDLVRKRLGALINDALTAVFGQIGAVAARLDPDEQSKLQDLALTVRVGTDDLVARAAALLPPSQLVAILAHACEAHTPNSLDALRCREAVYGGVDTLAREALLDLASDAVDPTTTLLRRLVATHTIGLFDASSHLATETVARLQARCLGLEVVREGQGARDRLDGKPSTKDKLISAIHQGQIATATALLASAAGVSRATVQAAICLRTAKGIVSLAWRAGLDCQFAATLQSALGRLPPDQILQPTACGEFPLTEPEMLWQCRFLARSQNTFAA